MRNLDSVCGLLHLHLRQLLRAFLGATLIACPQAVYPAGVVTNCTEAELRTALVGGGTVTFAADGVIPLNNTLVITNDTVFDATGRNVVLSGSNSLRVLYVNAGLTFSMTNVAVADGRSEQGAGLFNAGGTVNLVQCTFSNNEARGTNGLNIPYTGDESLKTGGPAAGGAICNFGDLWADFCSFSSNRSVGGDAGSVTNTGSILGFVDRGADGGSASGGAIQSFGQLSLRNCEFIANGTMGGKGGDAKDFDLAIPGEGNGGDGGLVQGGAVYQEGNLSLENANFRFNCAQGANGGNATSRGMSSTGGAGGDAKGGAVYVSGSMEMTNCVFDRNLLNGGNAGSGSYEAEGGEAFGGALLSAGGSVVGSNCFFLGNQAYRGCDDGRLDTGLCLGGGICNTGSLVLVVSTFSSNQVMGFIGVGGAVYHTKGLMRLDAATLNGNSVRAGEKYFYDGRDGNGSPAMGGGIGTDGAAELIECVITENYVTGGMAIDYHKYMGRAGGIGYGGGLWSRGTTDVVRCTFFGNIATGGEGSFAGFVPVLDHVGGLGTGGAIFSTNGFLKMINSTVFANRAEGGTGGSSDYRPGNGGSARAGGLGLMNSTVTITNCTVASNSLIAGLPGEHLIPYPGHSQGAPGTIKAGGIWQSNCTLTVQNTIISGNLAGDVEGAFVGSHNFVGGNPRLGALAANGGKTPTLALMPDSPAIDAADSASAPEIDQRGVARPHGPSFDIGAYEWNATSFYNDFYVRILPGSALEVVGPPNQSYRLQLSTNLSEWSDFATNVTDVRGLTVPHTSFITGADKGFFRSMSP